MPVADSIKSFADTNPVVFVSRAASYALQAETRTLTRVPSSLPPADVPRHLCTAELDPSRVFPVRSKSKSQTRLLWLWWTFEGAWEQTKVKPSGLDAPRCAISTPRGRLATYENENGDGAGARKMRCRVGTTADSTAHRGFVVAVSVFFTGTAVIVLCMSVSATVFFASESSRSRVLRVHACCCDCQPPLSHVC